MQFFKKYVLSSIWFAIMCFLLFSPSSGLPKGGLFKIPHLDKIVHIGLFAVLCVLYLYDAWRLRLTGTKNFLLFVFFSIMFAILSELIQKHFINGREGSVLDFCADITGLILGSIFYFAINKIYFKQKSPT